MQGIGSREEKRKEKSIWVKDRSPQCWMLFKQTVLAGGQPGGRRRAGSRAPSWRGRAPKGNLKNYKKYLARSPRTNKKKDPKGVETTSKGQDGILWGDIQATRKLSFKHPWKQMWTDHLGECGRSCISDNPSGTAWLCNQCHQWHFLVQIKILT